MRNAARTDSTQKEIIAALRKIGCYVYYLKLPMDLLVWHRERLMLVECKTEEGRLTQVQKDFIAEFPGEFHIVRTPEEAVAAVIGPEAMK